jgi:hypothetical protein
LLRSVIVSETSLHRLGQAWPPKGSRRDTKARPPPTVMHLAAMSVDKCIGWYADLKSTFWMKMRVFGNVQHR